MIKQNILGAAALLAVSAVMTATAMEPYDAVKLRTLDKITGSATDVVVALDETVTFGAVSLTVRACYQSPPEEQPPESAAFLEVLSARVNPDTGTAADVDPRLFSGWMFASSPGLNALEHPVYDVWVINCITSEPATD